MFHKTLVTACTIFGMLAQVDYNDTNCSLKTLLMTFKVIQYHSAWIMLMHNHKEST